MQKHTPKLFIAFKMAYFCCFGLGEILIIYFPSKKILMTSTTGRNLVTTGNTQKYFAGDVNFG